MRLLPYLYHLVLQQGYIQKTMQPGAQSSLQCAPPCSLEWGKYAGENYSFLSGRRYLPA